MTHMWSLCGNWKCIGNVISHVGIFVPAWECMFPFGEHYVLFPQLECAFEHGNMCFCMRMHVAMFPKPSNSDGSHGTYIVVDNDLRLVIPTWELVASHGNAHYHLGNIVCSHNGNTCLVLGICNLMFPMNIELPQTRNLCGNWKCMGNVSSYMGTFLPLWESVFPFGGHCVFLQLECAFQHGN